MTIFNQLQLGKFYSKKDLATVLGEDSLVSVREGVYNCKNSNSYLLFVDLEKDGKEEKEDENIADDEGDGPGDKTPVAKDDKEEE